ncbi:amidohydrolase family protein [Nannocystis sp. ILAH1]|uniref:amidohydrolase family protein n=1 Tax=unclassified Nannocystis TaxID=2627009 RepID=UPI00226DC474|nr:MULTISPECIES: amidohydrolase family protein [unclassified Nannocystis]MCY0986973.1 amidohydrolase family protein [Nannocystis sp. ILAH1]MCY1071856.1 amidohydrolase family protein [Nannocystis sp. RBIL2]
MSRLSRFAFLLTCVAACRPTPGPSATTPAATGVAAEAAPGERAGPVGAPDGKREVVETTVFHLHKFLQRIGVERDTYTRDGAGELEAKASFGFQDRGSQVTLAASFRLGPDGAPRDYQAWGKTSRMSSLDERVLVAADGSFMHSRVGEAPVRGEPSGAYVVASGYAPLLAQDLLLRAWVARGRPATMTLLPAATLTIESRGKQEHEVEGKRVTLEHVSVRGLVWGREDAWLDDAGRLVAVVTRDAEFDHFEAAREGFVALLPELVSRAGADGVAWLSEVGQAAVRGPAGVVALVGADLIDGTGRPTVRDAVVVYDGDKIVAAGPRASTPIPPGASTLDVSGSTILPGLWDMHAHVQQVEQGAAYLAAGVTTVRDLGNILEFVTGIRDTLDAGKGLGPRILVSGIVDGDGPRALGTVRIQQREDIAPVLDRLKRAGCLEVKLYSSVAPSLVRPIAEAAHRRGMRVVGHVPEGMSVLEAIAAGYDGVSHVQFLFDPLFAPGEAGKLSREARGRRIADADVAAPPLAQVVRAFAAKKVMLDDTLALYELMTHTAEENARREPGLAKLPRELRGLFDGSAPAQAALDGEIFSKYLALVGALHRAGVPIVAGTDISVPGHSLHRELELYVQAGFSPMAAIQAATSVPARMMGLQAQVGTVEPGKRADLVLVAGDPIADIRNVRKVTTVVARGRMYDPAALWRIAEFTP